MIRLAINGFGRIGRPSFKITLQSGKFEVVAINDLTDIETIAHLLKHDSLYGTFDGEVNIDKDKNQLVVNGKAVNYYSEPDPEKLPWKDLGVDVVLECTGVFREKADAEKHLKAGAKKVILSAPPASNASRSDAGRPKGDVPVFLLGVNEKDYKGETVISNGSCTTNCLAPMIKVLDDSWGVEKGFMTTTHSYTNDQRLLDLPHKDIRRSRAAAVNIIPTTTGAAKTVSKVIKHLEGNLDGIALRVPTPVVSIVDFVCDLKKDVTIEDVNNAYKEAAQGALKGILDATEEELTSMDYKANPHSVIVDLPLTMANGKLAKVVGWYDNEWAYSNRLVEMAEYVSK